MPKYKISISIYAFALLITAFAFLYSCPKSVKAESNLFLKLSPSVIFLRSNASSPVSSSILLQNISNEYNSFKLEFKPITIDAKGTIQLSSPNPALENVNSDTISKLKVSADNEVLSTIALRPKEDKTVILTFTPSASEKGSDHYIALLFRSIDPGNSQSYNSSVNSKKAIVREETIVGLPIMLSVSQKGPIEAEISYFHTDIFHAKSPVSFKINIKNSTRHYVTARSELEIRNIFDQKIGAVAIPSTTILSSQTKELSDIDNTDSESYRKIYWNEDVILGRYTVKLTTTISDGINKPVILKETTSFYAIPSKQLAVALLVVSSLIYIGYRFMRLNK